MIWHLLALVGIVLLMAIAGCWRSWLQYQRYGTWGLSLFPAGNRAQSARDCLGIALFILLMGQAIIATGWPLAVSPPVISSQGPIAKMAPLMGATLLFGGLALLVAAQLNLGRSWRIGIEAGAKPGLVTDGLYRFSRNPIFLALLITIAGYALLLPTRLSVALLVGAYIGIRQQIGAEEAHLALTYGEPYRRYTRRVGRFLPGIGKLR